MPDSISLAPRDPPGADAQLVDAILGGDARAFERMMRLYNRRLFRVARSIVQDDAEAEDAVQEGYIDAYRALGGFRGEARLSTWLTRIIVNQALARRRRLRTPAETSDDIDSLPAGGAEAPSETPEALAMRGELRRFIESAIDGLPEIYRGVFVMRAVEGLSVEETAACLAISQGTAKTRFLRARDQLRTALGRQLGPLLDDIFTFDGGRCDRIVAGVCARLGLAVPALPVAGERFSPTL